MPATIALICSSHQTGILECLHVNSCVTLFPEDGIGVVSFINFASSRISALINQHAFDVLMDLKPAQTLEEVLAQYEKNVTGTRLRSELVHRVEGTTPSHSLDAYAGSYEHSGYGRIDICMRDQVLSFERNNLVLSLEHWHYDVWAFGETDLFEIHKPHALDLASRIHFESSEDGDIAAFYVHLEPSTSPVRFSRQ